jgi:hypothetical protein
MNYSARYEQYLKQELDRCDSLHAFCQEIAWLATSEMTALELRQQQLLADLERLHEAGEHYQCKDQVTTKIIHQVAGMRKGIYTRS